MLGRIAYGRQDRFPAHAFLDLPRQNIFLFALAKSTEINFIQAGNFQESRRHVILGVLRNVFDAERLAAADQFEVNFIAVNGHQRHAGIDGNQSPLAVIGGAEIVFFLE